jgi:hypothetical protein
MRHISRLTATAAATIGLAVCASPALGATQPAGGSFTEGPETITSAKFADGNEIYTLTREAVFSGSYVGAGQADQRIVIHKDGSGNVNMTIAFAGTACGEPVVLTFLVTATVDFATNTMSGHYVVKDASGAGSDARGQGTFSGVPGAGGIYDGAIHCD